MNFSAILHFLSSFGQGVPYTWPRRSWVLVTPTDENKTKTSDKGSLSFVGLLFSKGRGDIDCHKMIVTTNRFAFMLPMVKN